MIIEPTLLAVGAVSFGLHFIGKWKETTMPFGQWFINKQSIVYWLSSLGLCALALLMQPEWAEALGMKAMTYAVVTCYGGGHLVSRFLGIKDAAAERKAAKE